MQRRLIYHMGINLIDTLTLDLFLIILILPAINIKLGSHCKCTTVTKQVNKTDVAARQCFSLSSNEIFQH